MANSASKVEFKVRLLRADMAAKGWLAKDLAKRARVSEMAVSRFFRREARNPRTVKKLARALGQPVERYVVSVEAA